MSQITVLVHGALGKMGQAVLSAVCKDPELEPVGAVDIKAKQQRLQLPDGSGEIPLSDNIEATIADCKPDVMVDFSQHDACLPAARIAAAHGVNIVIGTTGLSEDDLLEIERLCHEKNIGAVVAANFSLGAILMMHLAKIAGKFFDYAEIIELHHEQKLDSPSGTSLATAKGMVERKGKDFIRPESKKETIPGARGAQYGGITLHSVRNPGYMAHQEVILGGSGETLHIRHDQINREAFGHGITLAIKKVVESNKMTYGLAELIGLKD